MPSINWASPAIRLPSIRLSRTPYSSVKKIRLSRRAHGKHDHCRNKERSKAVLRLPCPLQYAARRQQEGDPAARRLKSIIRDSRRDASPHRHAGRWSDAIFASRPAFRFYVDSRVMEQEWVIVGGGGRSLKIKIWPFFSGFPRGRRASDRSISDLKDRKARYFRKLLTVPTPSRRTV